MVIPAAEGSDHLLLANNSKWRYVAGFHGLQMEAFRSAQHADYHIRVHVSSPATTHVLQTSCKYRHLKFHCPSVGRSVHARSGCKLLVALAVLRLLNLNTSRPRHSISLDLSARVWQLHLRCTSCIACMVALELHSPAVQQRQSDTFQQVDPVAALQQLVIQHRTARVATSRAAQHKKSASNSPHPLCPVSYSSKKQPSADEGTPRGCSSTSGSTPHHYANDGVRLSELGEQPLAIGTAEPLVFEEGELSFSLPATEGVVVSSGGVPDAAGEAGHTQHRKYVCSTKDDPLVKGRLGDACLLCNQQYTLQCFC